MNVWSNTAACAAKPYVSTVPAAERKRVAERRLFAGKRGWAARACSVRLVGAAEVQLRVSINAASEHLLKRNTDIARDGAREVSTSCSRRVGIRLAWRSRDGGGSIVQSHARECRLSGSDGKRRAPAADRYRFGVDLTRADRIEWKSAAGRGDAPSLAVALPRPAGNESSLNFGRRMRRRRVSLRRRA